MLLQREIFADQSRLAGNEVVYHYAVMDSPRESVIWYQKMVLCRDFFVSAIVFHRKVKFQILKDFYKSHLYTRISFLLLRSNGFSVNNSHEESLTPISFAVITGSLPEATAKI